MNKKKLIELRCKAWGITEDEYYCNQCSDFSLEDMARAYRRGKNKGAKVKEKELNAYYQNELDEVYKNYADRLKELQEELKLEKIENKDLIERVNELEAQIEKMKCCGNCAKNGHICVAEEMQGKLCGKNKDKWELRR